MLRIKTAAVFVFLLIVGACSNIKPLEVKYQGLEGSGFYSTSAATKATVVRPINDGRIICSEPAPDATYDEEASAALDMSLFNIGNKTEEGASEGEAEAGLGGRSINVLLTREMYFRMCEFFANTNISDSLKVKIYEQTLQSILNLNTINYGVGTQNGATSQAAFHEGGAFALPVTDSRSDSLMNAASSESDTGNSSGQENDNKDCTITSVDYPECLNNQ